jgi:hypothetical protein
MHRTLRSLVALLVALLMGALLPPLAAVAIATPSPAQTEAEGLANAILAARRKNASLLQQYNWNCRTEILMNGKMEDLRIDLVSVGADGQLSRTLLNDQPGQLPGGFLRRAIAQSQQQQAEQAAKGVGALLDQYTMPAAGKVIAFIVQAQVQPITSPSGTSLLQVSGSNVVVPGDTCTLVFDAATLQPTSIQISTTFEGNPLTASGTFGTMANGLNRLQYASAQIPAKQLSALIHNYDFVPAN